MGNPREHVPLGGYLFAGLCVDRLTESGGCPGDHGGRLDPELPPHVALVGQVGVEVVPPCSVALFARSSLWRTGAVRPGA